MNAFGCAPCGLQGGIPRSYLLPLTYWARPDFRRMSQRLPDNGGHLAVGGKRYCGAPAVGAQVSRLMGERGNGARSCVHGGYSALAIYLFAEKNLATGRPGKPTGG